MNREQQTRAALRDFMPSEGSLANPIDMLGGATAECFERVLPPVLADPAFASAIAMVHSRFSTP